MQILKRSIQTASVLVSLNIAMNACLAADVQPTEQAAADKVMFKPGQELTVSTDTEDITPTYDVDLARKQVAAFSDNPEAAFILAVALTRTSRVEEALKEVQRARRLAESKGGATYFDKMIASYEKMSTAYPDDNRARYELAWAYYMKAYLLAQTSRRTKAFKLAHPELAAAVSAAQAAQAAQAQAQLGQSTAAPPSSQANKTTTAPTPTAKSASANNADVVKILSGQANPATVASTIAGLAGTVRHGKVALDSIPHIPDALEKADAADVPQIRRYYELALSKIDEILQREPDDVWSTVYGAHLKAEYTGDLTAAMRTWHAVESKYPNNPASYFFLGEGYLKQGNLKESINHVSKAIALRALGN